MWMVVNGGEMRRRYGMKEGKWEKEYRWNFSSG
jgi:hypothetical protein